MKFQLFFFLVYNSEFLYLSFFLPPLWLIEWYFDYCFIVDNNLFESKVNIKLEPCEVFLIKGLVHIWILERFSSCYCVSWQLSWILVTTYFFFVAQFISKMSMLGNGRWTRTIMRYASVSISKTRQWFHQSYN